MSNKIISIKRKKSPLRKQRRFSGLLIMPLLVTMILAVFMTQCKKDDYEGEITGVCPLVIHTDPADEGINVVADKDIVATFNEIMDAATINTNSFIVMEGANPVSGKVTPSSAKTATFTFAPTNPLAPYTLYTATMKKGVRDPMRNALQEDYVWSFTTQPQITLLSNPLAGGTTEGAGFFDSGSSVTVKAVPADGYTFTNWTEGMNVVSASANYTFTMTGNRVLVANFTGIIPQYAVTLSSNPEGGGTTSGAGLFEEGTSVTVGATPAEGYTFNNWTEGENIVSSSASYTFDITRSRALVANFTAVIPQYLISLSSNPPEGGTTIGAGSYESGTSVTVKAVPAGGVSFSGLMTKSANRQSEGMPAAAYIFKNWTEGINVVSTEAEYTFIITGNRALVANFTEVIPQYAVTLSSNPQDGGTTSGEGLYESGTSVTVDAVAATGYTFTNWTEGTNVVSTTADYTFTITRNRALVANFTAITPQYTVTLSSNPQNGGTTSGAGLYDSGSSVTVGAVAATGYTFANWTEGASVVSSSANYSFIITGNRTLVANFTVVTPQYTVTLSSNPQNGGTTSGAGLYDSGSSVTVGAVPATGYTFTNWTEGANVVSSSANYSFIITANRTLVANFTADTPKYTVALSSNPSAGGTTSGAGEYDEGTSVTVGAVAAASYDFTNWTEGANIVSTDANYTFVITGNRTLVANFTIKKYTITLTSNPALGGTTTGAGEYDAGTSVTVGAVAATGYVFANWTEAGNVVSTDANYTFVITRNRALKANFIELTQQFTVTLSSNPSAGGTTTGAGLFDAGASVTVGASPATGYTFENWTEGANIVSTNANYTFVITGNRALVANFSVIKYNVTLTSNPASGGTTSGAGVYDIGTSVTVGASPATGYTFTNWTEGANVVSTNANYTFVITENRTLVANFTINKYTVALSSNPPVGGTTTGAGLYDFGSSVTVEAVAAVGFSFENWTEGANIVSTNANYTFVITGNRNLVANFTVVKYNVSLTSNPAAGGTTTGGGLYDAGSTVTVEADAATGYTFENWTEGANVVSINAIYTFVITGNRNLVANFEVIIIPPSGPPTIDLDCAEPYAVLAGSTITNTGPSIINGDVGLSPGSAITGFPPGIINGVQEITTPEAAAAKLCLTAAYIDGQGRTLNSISLPGQLGGLTLAPGLYTNASTSGISGTGANGILTLDAQGNSNAVWIFQIGSTFTTDPATSIVLAGGAQAKNIFWIVGTSATLGTNSVFYGNILADQSITLNTGAVLNGRALTRIGAVTMDASIITKP